MPVYRCRENETACGEGSKKTRPRCRPTITIVSFNGLRWVGRTERCALDNAGHSLPACWKQP
jgi:hypothetical protein